MSKTKEAVDEIPPLRILRSKEAYRRAGFDGAPTTPTELEARGLFPQRVQLTARTHGYLEHEVDSWIRGRMRLRAMSEKEKRRDPILRADLTRGKREAAT